LGEVTWERLGWREAVKLPVLLGDGIPDQKCKGPVWE
jgi:hypothetical protein